MISPRKRNRMIRKAIREDEIGYTGLIYTSFWNLASTKGKYEKVSWYQNVHEEILDDIITVGLLKNSKKVLSEKMNDEKYSEKAKEMMYHRYCWMDIDLDDLTI